MAIPPLAQLFDEASGEPLPLPPELAALYGPLRLARDPARPRVFANFVASLDGIVAIDPPRGTGADLSGGNPQDLAVMGLLRAVADAVVIGGGNQRAEDDHVWTAERVCPELAGPYGGLRAALGKPRPPLQIVVTGSGDLALSSPVFSGAAPAVVVTTAAGAERIRARRPAIPVAVPLPGASWIPMPAILGAAGMGPGALVLLESGPTSTTRFLEEGAVDELFLTRSPFLVGRGSAPPTLALVDGRFFAPGTRKGRLLSARRGGDFLFLRYAIS